MEHGEPAENPDDDPGSFYRAPLPPDDRIWRHPSELAFHEGGRRRGSRSPATWPTALVSGLLGAVLTWGVVAATGALTDEPAVREIVQREYVRPATTGPSPAATGDIVRIAEDAQPSITRVIVRGSESGSGSGVIFRDSGYLLTNAHVVDGARSIGVVLADGTELPGEVVGSDPDTDIAVVKIEGEGPFPAAVLGSATTLRVGQPAIAIGSPLGLTGGSSVTTGVISALGRKVHGREGPPLLDMIQTDAAISPGSSGGALLDDTGAVVGITTAIAVSEVGAEGLGFATPIDVARSVADDIIRDGRVVRVWLGIEGIDLDSRSAERIGVDGGARVQSVTEDSPAAEGGLRAGDVIVGLDGAPIATMSALVIVLRDLDPGDTVSLSVVRAGEESTVEVTLVERTD